jgi:hypothetical protein
MEQPRPIHLPAQCKPNFEQAPKNRFEFQIAVALDRSIGARKN